MTRQCVLFVGNSSHDEFCEPLAWLREYSDLTISPDLDAAAAQLAIATHPPDVIVLAAERPGLFSQQHVASLMRRAPLARCIGLMGGWCEGELRTGQPWRGVARVYWHQLVPRLAEELTRDHSRGRLAMPRTFTESECSGISVALPENKPRGLVVIRAALLETYEAIADACHAIGHSTVWEIPQRPTLVTGAIAVIWDVTASRELDGVQRNRLSQQTRKVPMIAILGFPRESDRQRAFACGASSVVSKPYLLQELWAELARVTAHCSPAVEQNSAA